MAMLSTTPLAVKRLSSRATPSVATQRAGNQIVRFVSILVRISVISWSHHPILKRRPGKERGPHDGTPSLRT